MAKIWGIKESSLLVPGRERSVVPEMVGSDFDKVMSSSSCAVLSFPYFGHQ